MQIDFVRWSLVVFCLACVFQDLKSRRVSNKTIIIGFVIISTLTLLVGGFSNLGVGLLSGFLIFLVGFLMWQFRVLGAGDVKVMAIVALTMNWSRGLEFVFYSLAWGSLLGLSALLMSRSFIQQARVFSFHPILTIKSQAAKDHKIPLTVGIFFGLLSLWLLESKGVLFL